MVQLLKITFRDKPPQTFSEDDIVIDYVFKFCCLKHSLLAGLKFKFYLVPIH